MWCSHQLLWGGRDSTLSSKALNGIVANQSTSSESTPFCKCNSVVLKHRSCVENKITNALSHLVILLLVMSTKETGFEKTLRRV